MSVIYSVFVVVVCNIVSDLHVCRFLFDGREDPVVDFGIGGYAQSPFIKKVTTLPLWSKHLSIGKNLYPAAAHRIPADEIFQPHGSLFESGCLRQGQMSSVCGTASVFATSRLQTLQFVGIPGGLKPPGTVDGSQTGVVAGMGRVGAAIVV
jgi:hypothetical protein